MAEFLDYARKQPPNTIAYSAIVAGSPQRLAFEGLLRKEGVKLKPVYYNASGASLNALMGKEASLSVLTVQAFASHHKAGSLRVIGVSSSERAKELADVPLFTELGYPDLKYGSWSGISVRAETPVIIKERLYQAVARVMRISEVQGALRSAGIVPITSSSADEYDVFLQNQQNYWKDILAQPGMLD